GGGGSGELEAASAVPVDPMVVDSSSSGGDPLTRESIGEGEPGRSPESFSSLSSAARTAVGVGGGLAPVSAGGLAPAEGPATAEGHVPAGGGGGGQLPGRFVSPPALSQPQPLLTSGASLPLFTSS
ncbi:unnamed protein product, partial [Laminaria digitata]